MCCFSQPIEHVSSTNIFARMSAPSKQYLVYSMDVAAQDDLAMILPIPAPPASPDDAVRFISLDEYPRFFADMDSGFAPLELSMEAGPIGATPASAPPLVVHDVGAFEASFVPTVADFDRLDARFRLPNETWSALPAYRDFGFAVFKLRRSAGPRTVHPMAFEFPLRDSRALFFPTLHIHDGKVHPKANFDHSLFCQSPVPLAGAWDTSPDNAGTFVDVGRSKGMIDGNSRCCRRLVLGSQENEDTFVIVGCTGCSGSKYMSVAAGQRCPGCGGMRLPSRLQDSGEEHNN